MISYSVIPAKREHLEGIEMLEKECFSLPWSRDNLAAYLPDDTHAMLCAVSDTGDVLGYVGLLYVLDEGYIANVAVSDICRRQGIASALIAELVGLARDKKLSFLTLEVRESNAPAIGLYDKFGFSVVGKRKNYYDKPAEDAILMTKFL